MSFEIKYDRDGVPLQNTDLTTPVVDGIAASGQETIAADQHLEETMESLDAPSIEPEKLEVKSTSPQESWKILREKAEQAERRAQQAEQLLQQYSNRDSSVDTHDDEDLNFSLDEDSLVEGKHLSKVDKKIQRLENQLKQYQQQAALSTAESRLKSQYPDFDHVVSAENLANLRAAYPEIAQTINSSNDLYSKAVSAYTMIKKLGISESDEYRIEKETAKRNAAKPRPMASISPQQGDSPLTKANAFANGTLTDELKAQLWKETNQYRK